MNYILDFAKDKAVSGFVFTSSLKVYGICTEDRFLREDQYYGIDCTNVRNSYPDMQRLMKVCDVGITDYSSWIYDYVLTGRPGFIYATDQERYNHNTGLYYPLEATPFPVCKNNEQLQKEYGKDQTTVQTI